ncbi:MAG: LptE family protein [Deltaproteobacteria bacterium]|nr:LptE family protein [Deltaproteobacteria bacterium]
MKIRAALLGMLCLSGCGYHFSTVKDYLPGGVKSIFIPTFQNHTKEAGIENTFTSALRNEFIKSKAIQVVDPDQAEGEIIGKVTQLSLEATSHQEKNLEERGTKILAREYSATVTVEVSLLRKKDRKILWSRTLSDSRRYSSAEDLLANETKQREAFDKISVYLMEQAHDQMFEDF